jgi:hypothetical protein
MIITGPGTVHDQSATYDDNYGTWTATFTSGASSTEINLRWNSSAPFDVNAPETGTSVLLLGLGLAAIGAYGQFRKNRWPNQHLVVRLLTRWKFLPPGFLLCKITALQKIKYIRQEILKHCASWQSQSSKLALIRQY